MVDIEAFAAWVDMYRAAHEDEKRAKAKKDQAKERIREYLEDQGAEVGTIQGVEVVRIVETAGRFDSKRFATEHPDLYEQYRGEPGTRFELVES